MTISSDQIKSIVANTLEKQGHSLADLEALLQDNVKIGSSFVDNIQAILSAGGAGGAAMGVLGGTGLYAAYKANQNSSDKQTKARLEQMQYEEATRQLREAMMANQHPSM